MCVMRVRVTLILLRLDLARESQFACLAAFKYCIVYKSKMLISIWKNSLKINKEKQTVAVKKAQIEKGKLSHNRYSLKVNYLFIDW